MGISMFLSGGLSRGALSHPDKAATVRRRGRILHFRFYRRFRCYVVDCSVVVPS